MRVTTWAEYGLIVSVHLAQRAGNGPIAARQIAEDEGLPADYVEQILLRLRRAGVVESVRGAKGGYFLGRNAGQISVKDVIEACEHGTFDVHCDNHGVGVERCAPLASCSIRPVWQLLKLRIDEVLSSIHLSDLLAPEAEVRQMVGLEREASAV